MQFCGCNTAPDCANLTAARETWLVITCAHVAVDVSAMFVTMPLHVYARSACCSVQDLLFVSLPGAPLALVHLVSLELTASAMSWSQPHDLCVKFACAHLRNSSSGLGQAGTALRNFPCAESCRSQARAEEASRVQGCPSL